MRWAHTIYQKGSCAVTYSQSRGLAPMRMQCGARTTVAHDQRAYSLEWAGSEPLGSDQPKRPET